MIHLYPYINWLYCFGNIRIIEEEMDEEEVYRQAYVMSECGGMEAMLVR